MSATTHEAILNAVAVGESTDWEFKSARGGLPGSLWETYSAMANSEGGCIVLGVSEDDAGHPVLEGLTPEQIARYQKQIRDTLNNRGKVSANLLSNHDVSVVDVGAVKLLTMRIPRAKRSERPVYLNGQPFANTYRRNHEGDYHCHDEEVRRMFSDASETPADHRVLEGFSLDDLDPTSLAQYRQRVRSAKGEHPWLSAGDQELLEKLGGWRRDRQSGQQGVTLAALLMFGRDEAIRDPGATPAFFVDYREKLDPELRWTDRIYPDGTWVGNLFQFFQRTWPKLAAGLPAPFQLRSGFRRDETPAHEALREAFVNALIHADYSAPGGVVIERHPDHYTMENPGTLLVSPEQFRRGGVSECRNRALQQMFLLMGGGERAGSGVDKILSGWKSQHWRQPGLRTQSQPDRVILQLPLLSTIPDPVQRFLQSRVGEEDFSRLSPEAVQALVTARLENGVTNGRLQELTGKHPADLTRTLRELCERNWLFSDQRGRWTAYRLAGPLAEEGSPELPLDMGGRAGRNSPQGAGDSAHKAGDSAHKAGDSAHKAGDFAHKAGDSAHLDMAALTQIAARVADSERASPTVTQVVIEELCRGRYLTAAKIGNLLNRNPAGIQKRFLNPMVRKGILRLRFRHSARRPDQAYTSAKEGAPE
ncbi:MAG: RNA-binding domain-containing protein [Chthoniobacteraceae bacterium]